MQKEATVISAFKDGYKVACGGKEYICKARGVFRTRDISPICGDRVILDDINASEPVIVDILDRKNQIIRPPLANLDQIVFVISTCEPSPNLLLLDKFLAVAEYKNISPVIVFTKTDMLAADDFAEIYRSVYPVYIVDNITGEGCLEVKNSLCGKFSALAGNSGSGKSSLINNICPEICVETAEISRKLGRGRHTTRRTEIFRLDCGGYVADTPGFSTFETDRYDIIFKDELQNCFPEFSNYIGKCRFQDCSHTNEPGCAVLEAVKLAKINKSRHESYCRMYLEAGSLKPWELKNQTKR